jgi:hypothetical protein
MEKNASLSFIAFKTVLVLSFFFLKIQLAIEG